VSPDAKHALPNCAAEKLDEDDEVERDHRKHDQRRPAFEIESAVCQIAGQIADRVTGDKEPENEVEHDGEHLAPSCHWLAKLGLSGCKYRHDSTFRCGVSLLPVDRFHVDIQFDEFRSPSEGEIEFVDDRARSSFSR